MVKSSVNHKSSILEFKYSLRKDIHSFHTVQFLNLKGGKCYVQSIMIVYFSRVLAILINYLSLIECKVGIYLYILCNIAILIYQFKEKRCDDDGEDSMRGAVRALENRLQVRTTRLPLILRKPFLGE